MSQPFALTPSSLNAPQSFAQDPDDPSEARVTLDSSQEFDRFLDELAERMAQEPEQTTLPLFAGGEHTPFAAEKDAALHSAPGFACGFFALDDEEPGLCLACGEETQWPVLCANCLEHLEEVDPELGCPFYVADARCAADCENGLLTSGCGGLLGACHHPELLSGLPAPVRPERRHEG